ncbi:exodeoxyribonuclease V subunit gamma [Nakamurella leprariae]|uniref:RecBCD enzyme subunit RecC n=1 Tax=Nakamurella leprariae TaxID=2803911 RepID=A0A938YGB2_9ACTN|nr:exodeoxyribonuclease V subunit gamma [Nakamurella leprariae]MBM9467298.1 exodeoxyribonuclease V subunit gamma [Nakamurella leprariae]
MPLFVHRAERSDLLADGLAEVLAVPPADPFAGEIVAVPTRGVERWLTQRLSTQLGAGPDRDGICAAVEFPSPRQLVATALGVDATVGGGSAADDDPWVPDRSVWPLLDLIDRDVLAAGRTVAAGGAAVRDTAVQDVAVQDVAVGGGAPPAWGRTLAEHLGASADGALPPAVARERRGRRYAVARRLAGLFDEYAAYRPAMLQDWSSGADGNGLGGVVPADLVWQPELWRRWCARMAADGVTDPVLRRAERLARLRSDPSDLDLPARVSVFGVTRLPRAQAEVLAALAEVRDVHLWVTHPSARLWDRVAASGPTGPRRRSEDDSALCGEHPLLTSLGRDARELQLTLSAFPSVDRHVGAPARPSTLLGRLQRDVQDDHRPARPGPVAADDRSVQVHACHGPARQIEVLREVLVGLLADDPTLEPRDVVVLCPDIETYAPLVSAAFGLADVTGEGHPAHRLRVRLADRALRQTNPLLGVAARLLDLAGSRAGASQLLDLAGLPAVRRRFRLDDDDLEQLSTWVTRAGVRWGLDAGHRATYGLDAFGQNTWAAGLDRILLGATMAEQDQNWLGLALPLDDIGSADVALAGRLAEFVARVSAVVAALDGRQPLSGWVTALRDGVLSLAAVPAEDLWQQTELLRELGETGEQAGPLADHLELGTADLRSLLDRRLRGRPTRANFRTGTLTVCTMLPMRSVPHRVVCLVGLDDGSFPRSPGVDGDDVLARDQVTGERDIRGEDRQLLLDAVLAAEQHLVITYTGADERTGARRPPAVPLGEILDALDLTGETTDGRPVRDQILVRHPLQPYDARNFTEGALGVTGPFSADTSALAAARAGQRPRRSAAPFVSSPLPARPAPVVELQPLRDLLLHPVRGFLRQRLDVAVRADETEAADELSVELTGLQRWAIGDRLLRQRLRGVDEETCRQLEWRRGELPVGPLGNRVLTEILDEVDILVDRTAPLRTGTADRQDLVVALADGRELRGVVDRVWGDRLVGVEFGRLSGKHRMRSWIDLLALSAAHPDRGWTAVTVGRGRGGARQAVLDPVGADAAVETLTALADLADRARREPLPLPFKASEAYADARRRSEDELSCSVQAAGQWNDDKFPGEQSDAAHVVVWGAGALFETVTAPEPAPDEHWAGERTRFGELALRLWAPLLAHERIVPL